MSVVPEDSAALLANEQRKIVSTGAITGHDEVTRLMQLVDCEDMAVLDARSGTEDPPSAQWMEPAPADDRAGGADSGSRSDFGHGIPPLRHTPKLADTLGTATNGPGTPPQRRSKALIFAWGVEGVAVAMGLILAIFAGLEGSNSDTAAVVIACLPFVALSFIELTKIPLIELAFQVRGLAWRMLTIVALLFVTGATFENFVFGFERGFNERTRAAETAGQTVHVKQNAMQLAVDRVPQLQARLENLEEQRTNLDKEMAASRDQAQTDIANARTDDRSPELRSEREKLRSELGGIAQRRFAEINRDSARCRAGFPCHTGEINAWVYRQRDPLAKRLAQIDSQERAERARATNEMTQALGRRDTDLADLTRQREELQHQIDNMGISLTEAEKQAQHGGEEVAEAVRVRDVLVDRSQLHRLSDVLFGNHEHPAVQMTKKIFVTSLAAIVAVIGSVIATMHYAAQVANTRTSRRLVVNAVRGYLARRRARIPLIRDVREAARQRNRMVRAIRSYYAAKRAKLVREVPIVKEVPVDRLKIVFLPETATEADVQRVRAEAMTASRPLPSDRPAAVSAGCVGNG